MTLEISEQVNASIMPNAFNGRDPIYFLHMC